MNVFLFWTPLASKKDRILRKAPPVATDAEIQASKLDLVKHAHPLFLNSWLGFWITSGQTWDGRSSPHQQ